MRRQLFEALRSNFIFMVLKLVVDKRDEGGLLFCVRYIYILIRISLILVKEVEVSCD